MPGFSGCGLLWVELGCRAAQPRPAFQWLQAREVKSCESTGKCQGRGFSLIAGESFAQVRYPPQGLIY